jgi:1-acyl-sn-glycerol-3-phosphate acyltransferase
MVSVSAVLGLAFVLLATLPLVLVLTLLHDACRRNRLGLTRTALLVTLIAVVETLGLTACFLTWLAAGLRTPPRPWTYLIQRWWQVAMYRGFERIFGVTTRIEPHDPALARGPFLLFSRHAGYFDTLLPLVLLPPGLQPRYVLMRPLLNDPCLDIAGHRVPNCFVGRGVAEMARVGRLADDLTERDFVVIFPEGGRFTQQGRARLMESRSRLLAARAARLRHVLPPQRGGALALLSRSEADVVLCVHSGLERLGDLPFMAAGGLVQADVKVRFWRVPRARIPSDPGGRVAWLNEQWQAMDDWLETMAGVTASSPARDRKSGGRA